MNYHYSHGQQSAFQVIKPGGAGHVGSTQAGKALRVLMLGTGEMDGPFHAILAANIQRWGYEAIPVPAGVRGVAQEGQGMTGDILLYDMDAFLQPMVVWGEMDLTAEYPADFTQNIGRSTWPRVRLVIALSSRSVSRRSLERFGAVAFLHKPFDMRHLERYLRVFRRLLSTETEESAMPALTGQRSLEGEHVEEVNQALLAPRILVADDRREVTRAIRQCLIEQGRQRYHYDVREVHDGLELLEQCLIWRPHCVVTDLLMPWLNGYQVMRCLADCTIQPMPAFVVISALMQHELPVSRSYLRDQVVLYVDKPFDGENLLATIEQALAE